MTRRRRVGLRFAHHRLGDRDHACTAASRASPATSAPGGAGPPRRSTLARKPSSRSRLRGVGQPARHGIDAALRPVLGLQIRRPSPSSSAAASSRSDVSVPLATLNTSSLDVGLQRQHVGPGDVVDVDEVHRLLAVAEDQRRLAGGDALHPADQHFGVLAVDVHARAVDVEVAQRRRTAGRASRGTSAAAPRASPCWRRTRCGCCTGGGPRASGTSRPARRPKPTRRRPPCARRRAGPRRPR